MTDDPVTDDPVTDDPVTDDPVTDEVDRALALEEAAGLVGVLADSDRLRVAAALVLESGTPRTIADATELRERDVMRALARLDAAGLAAREGGRTGTWSWVAGRLPELARALTPPAPSDDFGTRDESVAAVLRTFIRNGRLMSIPMHRGKRLVVLDHVVRVFEPGVRYPEAEVNAMLSAFHDDVAALRRYLVDELFLSRESGVYWRTGGTVDV